MIRISIGGVFEPLVVDTLTIDNRIEERTTATFMVDDADFLGDFAKGMPVIIEEKVNSVWEIIFQGVVEQAERTIIAKWGTETPYTRYLMDCIDYHYAADKRVAARSYQDEPVQNIVNDLFTEYLEDEGISIGNIDDGITLDEAVFNYVKVSDALDNLAEQTGFWWLIDENKQLQFLERGTNVAPWTATQADARHGTIKVKSENPRYRNRQIIKNAKDLTSVQTERQRADGETQSFTVGYPVARVPTVSISTDGGSTWIAQTVGIKGLSEGDDWYWSAGDPTITQEPGDPPLNEGDIFRAEYQGEFPIVIISRDPDAIIDRQTVEGGGTGLVEDVKSRSELTTREAGFQLAAQLIDKYGSVGQIISFRTTKKGLRPGQLLTVDFPDYKINDQFLIESVTATDEQAKNILYTISAIQGPEVRSWANLFKAILQEASAAVRVGIGADESLVIPYQFEKQWTEAESPNIFTERNLSEGLDPANDLFPRFDPNDRVKYIEWMDGATVKGRKAVTQVSDDNTTLFSISFLSPSEGDGTITDIRWVAGIEATATIGTGIIIDTQNETTDGNESPWTKTDVESWQIEKSDIRWV